MNKTLRLKITATVVVLATITVSAITLPAAEPASDAGFKFQAGLTYLNGVKDLVTNIEANNPRFELTTILPVGLSLNPYYEFGNGLGIGLSVGPAILGFGDASFHVVPVGADLRYTFLRDKPVSPYVRAGVQYPFAGGDFIESSSIGFVGVAGVEFGHRKSFGWGVEAGYNSSEVKLLAGGGRPAVNVKPFGFNVGLFFRF